MWYHVLIYTDSRCDIDPPRHVMLRESHDHWEPQALLPTGIGLAPSTADGYWRIWRAKWAPPSQIQPFSRPSLSPAQDNHLFATNFNSPQFTHLPPQSFTMAPAAVRWKKSPNRFAVPPRMSASIGLEIFNKMCATGYWKIYPRSARCGWLPSHLRLLLGLSKDNGAVG